MPKINFSVPFLPPLQPFGLNCLKCFLSLFLKWTVCPSRLLFLTSTHTAVPLRGRKPQRGLVSWRWAEESSCLISGLYSLLMLLWRSLEVPSNLNGCLRQWGEALSHWPACCREAVISQMSCNHTPALIENVHSDHCTQKVQAEAQSPKICLLESNSVSPERNVA